MFFSFKYKFCCQLHVIVRRLQGYRWPLKGQILAIFPLFGPVFIHRKLDHPMGAICNTYIYIYISSVSMQKFDLEAVH